MMGDKFGEQQNLLAIKSRFIFHVRLFFGQTFFLACFRNTPPPPNFLLFYFLFFHHQKWGFIQTGSCLLAILFSSIHFLLFCKRKSFSVCERVSSSAEEGGCILVCIRGNICKCRRRNTPLSASLSWLPSKTL